MRVLSSLAVVALTLGTLGTQAQFRTRVDLVRLDVGVTDDDGHVGGLTAADFVVEDLGALQSVTVEEMRDTALDLVVVAPPLSAVHYVAGDQVHRVGSGVEAFFSLVEARDRLAVVLASPPPRLLRPLEPGPPPFALQPFTADERFYSAPFDAIAMGLSLFSSSERRPVLVAFTNAADFRSVLAPGTVAQLVGRLGPSFVVVGMPVSLRLSGETWNELRDGRQVGDAIESTVSSRLLSDALVQFVRRSGGQLVNLADDHPRQLMTDLVTALRSRYVLTYPLPKGDGRHDVRVRVKRRGLKISVRDGYFVTSAATPPASSWSRY